MAALQSRRGSETERIAQLAEGLLVLARGDEGKLALVITATPVDAMLEAVAARYRRRAQEAGMTIVIDDQFRGVADVDATQIERALGNLVENALSYGKGTITLSAALVTGRLRLAVEDEGAGFASDFLPRAFERFSQADQARTGSGVGLGLAIVDTIAAAHGGTVMAANRSPHGGMVKITIPVEPVPASAARKPGSAAPRP